MTARMADDKSGGKWDTVFTENSGGVWYPDEGLVKFSARYLKRRMGVDAWLDRVQDVTVLDVGCGYGCHVVFFAEQGFTVSGIVHSKNAVRVAEEWLKLKNLSADVSVGNIDNLPFEDDSFNVVTCIGVFDHVMFSDAKKAIQEINRVLTPGGYMYFTLHSDESSECGRGKKIDENTYILQQGYETGLVQHFFNLKEIAELFGDFKVFEIELHDERFPKQYTVDKNYLQSSQGIKKSLDLDNLDLGLKDSRWHIGAEKPQSLGVAH